MQAIKKVVAFVVSSLPVVVLLSFPPLAVAQTATEGGTSKAAAPSSQTTSPNDEAGRLISGLLGEVDDRWTEIFRADGHDYAGPRIVLFRNSSNGGRCGMVQTVGTKGGASYCAPDRMIYIDPADLFKGIETRYQGCRGNACSVAAAYVIAFEVGHHLQNLLGITPRIARLQEAATKEEADSLRTKVELQASCLAGVWFNLEEKKRPRFLAEGDMDAVMVTVAAYGDAPDASDRRKQWFTTGYRQGALGACNTFAN